MFCWENVCNFAYDTIYSNKIIYDILHHRFELFIKGWNCHVKQVNERLSFEMFVIRFQLTNIKRDI